tara:strand:- start:127 stop:312 length:186 start_codon:yes stop_codon:yes gene_type:complete
MQYERLNKMQQHAITVYRTVEQKAIVIIDLHEKGSISDLTATATENLNEMDWDTIRVRIED